MGVSTKFAPGDKVYYNSTDFNGGGGGKRFGTVVDLKGYPEYAGAANIIGEDGVWALWERSSVPGWMAENKVYAVEPERNVAPGGWKDVTDEEYALLKELGAPFEERVITITQVRFTGGK